MLEVSKLNPNYVPIIYDIKGARDSIFKYKPNPKFSTNIDYPKFSLGFHHYIHQTKDKMSIAEQFEGKKKVYYIFNRFERYVDEYEPSIGNISKMYFNTDPKPNILSRAFYKLWEMLFMFDLIQTNKPNLVTAHLAEGPGSFIQATMFYRDKFSKKGISKNDKYYAITLHSEKEKKGYVPKLEESFVKYYNKENPIRFFQHKTVSKDISRVTADKDNGDLTRLKTINLFGGNFQKTKAHFVTADGGFNWTNENTQEQEAYKLILGQIITAIKIQDKKGNFVCKFFESFTTITIKFFFILKEFYNEIYIVKPLMSRQSNSEKYVICKDFKFDNEKEKFTKISMLESILKDAERNNKLNIVDIFPDFIINDDSINIVKHMNINISNKQLILINNMADFVQEQNYRGEKYQERRQMQIEASDFWINIFLPDTKDYDKLKKEMKKFTENIIEKNNVNFNEFKKILR